MTRSKSKKEKAAAEAAKDGHSSSPGTSNNAPAAGNTLIICRNKHWRYISSFHGPWLQLPPEVLESLAYSNYAAPRPRPIDPAVFFDLVKIRRNVDEATTLAVRAASGIASAGKDHHLLFGISGGGGGGGGGGARLSRERKHRMRELATQKLAKAYKLDEIAASVATMQSASSLEDVAGLVLQREAANPDAQYVHFFHEKIPSRMLAKCTPLTPLDNVIVERPTEGAPLRTRAVTQVFKEDYMGAASDLTKALTLGEKERRHDAALLERGARLGDDDMPSSLQAQLLFHRAGTYLAIAMQAVEKAIAASDEASNPRKNVRTYAKRALRDYSRFLAGFEYSPQLPDIYTIAVLLSSPSPTLPPPGDQEILTYHPLMTDALYSTLLCHLLLATPQKELSRHVAMVARLARIADGYPVFLAARSPARADWGEVVKRASLEFDGEPAPAGSSASSSSSSVCGVGQGEYPVSTERAGLIARWVLEGWGGVVAGGASRRRRKGKALEVEPEPELEEEEVAVGEGPQQEQVKA